MEEANGKKAFTLAALADATDAELLGEGNATVTGVNSVDCASGEEICFVTSGEHEEKLGRSKAGAVLVSKRIDGCRIPQLVVAEVNTALIKVLNLFAPKLTVTEGVHPKAVVEDSAVIGKGVSIGPGAYVSHRASIGDGTMIAAGCVVGENSRVGANCRLDGNVVVYHNCRIGDNCIIQANTTIGSTGFGYRFIDGAHRLIPHNGGVVIEDCVEIGANCSVDRAKFGDTVIGAGTKIDNLVQVAHNVRIGKCCLLAGQSGLSGSCTLGDSVVVAGQSGVRDHIKVGSGGIIGAKSGVMRDIPDGLVVLGIPAIDARHTRRVWASQERLPEVIRQLRSVSKAVEKLKKDRDIQ